MEKIIRCDRVRSELVLYRVKGDRNVLLTVKRRKANGTGRTLRRNCLVKHYWRKNRSDGITVIGSLISLLGVKIVHLVERSDLFKISNLVYGGLDVLRSLYNSLQGQTVYDGYSELAVSLFFSVKINVSVNFLEQLTS
jgi:hypothetical protein